MLTWGEETWVGLESIEPKNPKLPHFILTSLPSQLSNEMFQDIPLF